MSDEWDADDFEPEIPKGAATDKWEGEDEDDVKDSWEEEDDEKKKDENKPESEEKAYQRKKKKPLAERIAEKEAARAAELEKEKEEKQKLKEMTAEERFAEKLRQQKIQEEADLRLAKEAFGVSTNGIDAMFPVTEEDFAQFKDALKGKITEFQSSKHYSAFLEQLFQDLIIDMDVEVVKRISGTISSMAHEKLRQHKEAEKKKKKKSKAVIRTEREKDFGDIVAGGQEFDDYDDFI